MKLNVSPVNRFLILGVALALAGCDSLSSTVKSSASTPAPTPGLPATNSANLVGKVALSNPGQQALRTRSILARVFANSDTCQVNVYDLAGSSVLATGTTDANGKFVISGGDLQAGRSYKVVTLCGDTSFSAIIGADNTAAKEKTPTTVDANATLKTVEIVKAVVSAIDGATQGLSGSVAEQVQGAVLSPDNVSKISATVSSTIDSAISSGSLKLPSDQASSAMAVAIAATSAASSGGISDAEKSYQNDPALAAGKHHHIPVSVHNAVKGAATSVAAFPGCDPSLGDKEGADHLPIASIKKCTQAVSKMMFNVIHFDIAILKNGGAFGNIACSSNDPVLSAAFPNAKFVDGAKDAGIADAAFCGVHSALAPIDRNRSYSSGGGNYGGGPLFSESGGTVPIGVLTAMGQALFSGYKYHLSDMDKLVFASDPQNGGMMGRLVYKKDKYSWPAPPRGGGNYVYNTADYFLLSNNQGVTIASNAGLPGGVWPSDCNASPCSHDRSQDVFAFSGTDWSTAQSHVELANALASSSWAGSVFLNALGGPIPSQARLEEEIVNAKTHQDYNRTGQAQFYVLYSEPTNWNDPNCQWGVTPVSWTNPVTVK